MYQYREHRHPAPWCVVAIWEEGETVGRGGFGEGGHLGRMMRSAVLVRRVTGARLATGCHSPVRNLHNVTVSAELMGMPRNGHTNGRSHSSNE